MLPLKTILYATDFSEQAKFALRMACSLAADHGARLIMLHVMPPATVGFGEELTQWVYEDGVDHARSRLKDLEPNNQAIEVETRLQEGNPAAVIVDVARETGASLIVLGTHGRTGLSRILMGSIAEEVLRKAPCPVLTVKANVPLAKPTNELEQVHASN
jgi:nucleotide-binding universal stress UspA family protein